MIASGVKTMIGIPTMISISNKNVPQPLAPDEYDPLERA